MSDGATLQRTNLSGFFVVYEIEGLCFVMQLRFKPKRLTRKLTNEIYRVSLTEYLLVWTMVECGNGGHVTITVARVALVTCHVLQLLSNVSRVS